MLCYSQYINIRDRNCVYKYRIDDLEWFYNSNEEINYILNKYFLNDISEIIISLIKPNNYFVIDINK